MKKNNYNTNSNGADIECVCYYDNDSARFLFTENFKHLPYKKTRYGSFDVFFYTEYNQIDFDDSTKTSGKLKDFKNIGEGERVGIWRDEYKNAQEYKKDVAAELIASYGFQEAQEIAATHNININYKNNIKCLTIRGYSQGDYAEILVDFTQLKALRGADPDESELRDRFHNLFYDSPIRANFLIEREEYFYDETPGLKSEYDWDRESWLKYVSEESGIDSSVLSEFVPEYPSYNI